MLECVPSAYQYRLNTVEYMDRYPGQVALNSQGSIFPDYKLNFAREYSDYR